MVVGDNGIPCLLMHAAKYFHLLIHLIIYLISQVNLCLPDFICYLENSAGTDILLERNRQYLWKQIYFPFSVSISSNLHEAV